MINKNRLKQLLTDTESYHVEKTSSTTDMNKFCQAICAFSNDVSRSRKNGYLILGVHDNGDFAEINVDDKLMLKISNIRTDGNILPQPVMAVEKFTFAGNDVLVVEVKPSKFPPVRYQGRVWVRVGPRKSIASEEEVKLLTERKYSSIRNFDAMPCYGTTINDLDVSFIKREYLPKAVAEDILEEDKRPVEEQLASLGFYDLQNSCPTNGAIILFGKKPELYLPGSYIQYVKYKGEDRAGDIINSHKFSGNLCSELPKIDTFIETGVSQKRPIPVSVLREETVSNYPYWATRELLMNAIMHRDYETNSPVLFYEYDDRIEIQNPGGLYGKVTPNNFPNVSDYRNPFIAEAMKILGYVNRFSRGIYRVQRELIENGNGKASFNFKLITTFNVIEKISKKYFEIGFGIEDDVINAKENVIENTKENIAEGGISTALDVKKQKAEGVENSDKNVIENSTKNTKENVIENTKEIEAEIAIENTKENVTENTKENIAEGSISTALDVKKQKAKSVENSDENVIENSTKNAKENVIENTKENTLKNTKEKSRKKVKKTPKKNTKENLKIQKKILHTINSNPQITISKLSELLERSQDSARHHLRKMVNSGLIKHEGATKAGKWIIL